jgi:hypothetical protein
MTIFTVLMPSPQPNLSAEIKRIYPLDHLSLNETQWLISATGTVTEVCAKLGIYDPSRPTAPMTGLAVVFTTTSYFGRAPTNIWDWLKAKLESPPSV